jgi:rhodanese-related sulfurtransferase
MTRTLTCAVALVLFLGAAALADPKIAADLADYDFGTILEGYAIQHTFVLTNAGDEKLIIEGVRPQCGCTTVALSTYELVPGQSVELKAVVNTTGYGGSTMTKTIEIHSNDPRYNDGVGIDYLGLHISGKVLAAQPYHMTGEQLYDYFVVLVDLRSADEYAAGHLVGAYNIPSEDLLSWIDALHAPEAALILLYDETGALAYEEVARLHGDAWALSGGLANKAVDPNSVPLVGWTGKYGAEYFFPTPSALAFDVPAPIPSTIDGTKDTLTPEYVHDSAIYVLIDLREPEVYAAGHLAGATNIPHDAFRATTLESYVGDIPRDARIILYDDNGIGTDVTAQDLRAAGFEHAKSLVGGFNYWEEMYGDQLVTRESP